VFGVTNADVKLAFERISKTSDTVDRNNLVELLLVRARELNLLNVGYFDSDCNTFHLISIHYF
jgi:hypothetical protein